MRDLTHRAPRWLGSTYRLQLRPGDLDWARERLAYLSQLGVETVYLSPIATATPGSSHGYDVADPNEVDPALGGWPAWARFAAEASRLGLGVLVDHVPNHQAANEHNRAWADVLRRGAASRFARFFDVDWAAFGGRITLAVLARPFADALAVGEVRLAVARPDDADGLRPGEPVALVAGHRFPLAPGSWSDLAETPGELVLRLRRASAESRRHLAELLERQHWRLAWWRSAPEAISHRRFFDIDELVGVRVEDPVVFAETHRLLRRLAASPAFAGVRIDHPDGLADPATYLARLGALLDDASAGERERPCVVVEKILAPSEGLRADWAADGTTGYELSARVFGLLAGPKGGRPARRDERRPDFAELSAACRAEVLARLFPGEADRLARRLATFARTSVAGHDLTTADVGWALRALLASLDVYRPYVSADAPTSPEDRVVLERAVARALQRLAAGSAEVPPPSAPLARLDPRRLLEQVASLLLDPPEGVQRGTEAARPWGALVARFAQLASAVAAKGVEDTALYRLAGNSVAADVGADPTTPPPTPATLVAWAAERSQWGPRSLNPLATHDAKRSGDVRARLAVLEEMAEAWRAFCERLDRRHRPPDPVFAHRCYEAAVAIWPLGGLGAATVDDPRRVELLDRLQRWAIKAAREAKLATSWTDPDPTYEAGVASFLAGLFQGEEGQRFVADVDRLAERIGAAGATNSLASVALAACLPGVPDVYQGTERFAHLLVDPDNRRPVDFDGLEVDLDQAGVADVGRLAKDWQNGLVKVRLTTSLLHLRRRAPRLFSEGDVVPLRVDGERAGHVVALARQLGDTWALCIVARHTLSLAPPGRLPVGERTWGESSLLLPPGAPSRFVDAVTGAEIHARRRRLGVADLLAILPVAVVVGGRAEARPSRR